MRIEFLGTGGATTTPRPSCQCSVCVEARERGIPYSRTGPSLFIHGPDVLFDTPEESNLQLNRSGIDRIAGCFYSHWHPDHTMGRRVWETRNVDLRGHPAESQRTNIYLPEQVALDVRERMGLQEHFDFMTKQGTVQVIELQDGISVEINGVEITPFRLAEDYVYAFLLVEDEIRVLFVPDELHGWSPDQAPFSLNDLELAILPMGVTEFNVFSGVRQIHRDHKVLETEMTFHETLDVVQSLGARRTILTHIEEMEQLSFDELRSLERKLFGEGIDLTFAWDTMVVDVPI
jgi:phosphoribosyl 1,2-cyclic phosphate phosphodiesterase